MSTQNSLDNQLELEQFMSMLTPNYRQEVTTHIFRQAFELNKLLRNHPEIIKQIVIGTIPHLEQPDNEILNQGNEASCFYFIAEGDCKVSIVN